MAISVRLGEGSDTDPTSDRSHRFWGGSIFDEEDDAIKDIQANGATVLMTMIQPQPLYMLQTMDVIPALVPERNTFATFEDCTEYLRKTL
ncbi:MAG: hypothetical protein J6129_07225 [Bacteroidaceae bacterium]|nr:hypothetical protein [Bacteroidaceae bacterium]